MFRNPSLFAALLLSLSCTPGSRPADSVPGSDVPPEDSAIDVSVEGDQLADVNAPTDNDLPQISDVPLGLDDQGSIDVQDIDIPGEQDLFADHGGGCIANCGDMVLVPKGSFMMGCDGAKFSDCWSDDYSANAEPYHLVDVPTFGIDKFEVSISQYKACVDAATCTVPVGTKIPWEPNLCNWDVLGRELHPVNCIDWSQAKAYCEWTGKRLCSEAEWEKAARGTDERRFPWGNENPTCQLAAISENGSGCGTGSTMQVGSFPLGVSPYGAMDMSGNVSEWVQDWYRTTYDGAPTDGSAWEDSPWDLANSYRVMRGGDFDCKGQVIRDVEQPLRSTSRSFLSPSLAMGYLGARCCRTP